MTHRELQVPNDTAHLAQVRKSVLEVIGNGVFTARDAQMVALAIDEAIANVMEHAYSEAGIQEREQLITLLLDLDDARLVVTIRDAGKQFDPTVKADVDVREQVKQGKKGGLGIFLMRKIMDEVNYSYKRGLHNELQLVKYRQKLQS